MIDCERDTVIFIQARDESELIETGDKLGDMTAEMKPYLYISEFVSGGHRNNASKLIDNKDVSSEPKTVLKSEA